MLCTDPNILNKLDFSVMATLISYKETLCNICSIILTILDLENIGYLSYYLA